MTTPDTAAIREAITEHWGPRCRTLDTEDFPELVAIGEGRCPACRAWEQLDALCDALDTEQAENERLQTIIDNLHAVEEKHRETANAEFHRANRLQVDNERLTKERDEARAQVKVALQLAVNMVWDIQPQTCTANVAGTIGRAIRALTPAHAKAALEAYGREKVREWMQHMLNRLQHEGQINPSLTYADAIEWAEYALADMETLK